MTTHASRPEEQRLVIVGNGMATHRLLERLIRREARPGHIRVFGDEPQPAYNRLMLSPLLAGEIEHEAIALREANWYAEHAITLHCTERVIGLDRHLHEVVTAGGERYGYDRLILATGSRPRLFDLPGAGLEGIHGFRTTTDVATLAEARRHGRHAVVVGGGLLGLEAAEGLRKRGMAVTVVHRGATLMNRQLDRHAATLLADELSGRGLQLRLQRQPRRYEGNARGRVQQVVLDNGERLAADLVVMAAGIVPNAELGFEAGLAGDHAIAVDDTLTTSDPAISALGECCEFEGSTFGLVEPIWAQVEVLVDCLCGLDNRYSLSPTATRLKISGIDLYSFGPLDPGPEDEVLRYVDAEHGDYRRLILRHNVLVGAVLYGDTRDGPWYFQQSLEQRDLTRCRDTLLFGATDATQQLEEAA
ncbi:assimilatory nitrate reductase (NADH) beta subunit [Kushneria sinocarnis]|uniref:Assimilatory nitrate reductase (NADH) beta subunit n=1 Tax=Kushneria sinocarnis TaxID=595502 RepID=A0A420WUA0_9GAMM|nr:FAD-dependent oxidoreductase [Kushneria sinocarnis]RKQ97021.1 assimilatory nitrate reductase (NADH) beta subunit [Kushneria sinocarnis]